MKRKQSVFITLIISGLFILSSCASLNTPQTTFPDDVYGRAAKAKPLPERQSVPDEQYSEDYYDENYIDGYEDGYYANRLNRFYYYTPGMSYYDPFFDPWIGYSPYGYGGFGLSLGFGFGGWGNPWYSPYGSFYGGWGYPYNSWGPYSYYDRFGYGYGGRYGYGYGLGYYPRVVTVRPIRTRPSNLGTDNIGNRSTRPSRGTVSSANGDRNVRPSATRSGTTRPGQTVRPGQTTRPTRGEATRPGSTTRPTQTRPTQTRPTQTRPTQTTRPSRTESARPAPVSRPSPSYTPSRSSGGSSSSGTTSSGSSTRPSRSR
jgi:hypothetical protein